MGETASNEQVQKEKKSFFKGLKAEFKKIIWPDKETVGKQAVAVICVSVVLGIVIAILDFVMVSGINAII